jgi:hypothetical protein
MKNVIPKKGVYAVATRTIETRKPETVALMQKYGMNVSQADSNSKIDKAFFALLPRSRGFRNDFSTLASEVAANMRVSELSMDGYANSTGGNDPVKSAADKILKANEKASSGPKAFEDTTVGKLMSNDAIKNLLNTGLSVWAYKKTGGGVGSYQDSLLDSANVNSGSGSGSGSNQSGSGRSGSGDDNKPDKKGLDIGLVVVVAIAALAGAGFVIFKAVKNK